MPHAPSQRFANKVAIVTGASRGLGQAIARAFAAEGASVVLAGRNSRQLQQVGNELMQQGYYNILTVNCDVSCLDQVQSLVTQTLSRFSRVDILVNNAGTGMIAPIGLVQIADAHALFQTNFFGALHCIQVVLPLMKRQHGGHIVNIASLAGLRGIPNSAVYSASKAALIALADSLRIELRNDHIELTTVCPGRISDTGFFANAKTYGPLKLINAPEIPADAAARATLDAIISHKRLVILPAHARFTHYLNKFAPSLLDRILYKKMPRLDSSVTL